MIKTIFTRRTVDKTSELRTNQGTLWDVMVMALVPVSYYSQWHISQFYPKITTICWRFLIEPAGKGASRSCYITSATSWMFIVWLWPRSPEDHHIWNQTRFPTMSTARQNNQCKFFNAMPFIPHMHKKKPYIFILFILYKNIIASSCLRHIISADRGVQPRCDCNIHLAEWCFQRTTWCGASRSHCSRQAAQNNKTEL